MYARLNALAIQCRNRGGHCPCRGPCQAQQAVDEELAQVSQEERDILRKRHRLELLKKRLGSPLATLKDGFVFKSDPGLTPVIVFDFDQCHFGYETTEGEWIEQDEWPFNEDYVWEEDCKRLGFEVH